MIDNDGIAQLIWVVLVLLMVVSSLTARRVPLARLVTWGATWAAIFLGAYLLFTLIQPQFVAWQQSRRSGTVESRIAQPASSAISPQATAAGAAVTLTMREDGHYWVEAAINGRSVRFLVDSGASVTAVSRSTADSLGLSPDPMGRTMEMETANGTVTADRSVIPAMAIGSIEAKDLPVVVSASFGEVNVLGMNFLNKLKSWRVEGGQMILEP